MIYIFRVTSKALLATLFLLSCVFVLPARAQSTSDPQAVATVQAAIAALGGTQTIASIVDVTAVGTCEYKGASAAVIWQRKGNEKRFQRGSGSNAVVFITGHGSPKHAKGGTPSNWSPYASKAAETFYSPATLLLKTLKDPIAVLTYLGPDAQQGGDLKIRVQRMIGSSPLGAPEDWWFNPVNGLPVSVDRFVPAEASPSVGVTQTATLGSYETVQGVLYPTQISLQLTGLPAQTCSLSSVQANSGLADSLFDTSGAQ